MNVDQHNRLKRVGCFGKLPDKGDFFRVWESQPAARSFDAWLQRGMHFARQQLGPRFKETYRQAGSCRFLLTPANSGQTLYGVMTFSHDKHGREYPLVCFGISGPARAGVSSLQVVDSSTFYHVAEALVGEARRGLDAGSVAAALPGLDALTGQQAANRRAFAAFVEQTAFSERWSPVLLQEAVALLSKSRPNDPRLWAWGVKVPLGQVDNDGELEVAFWTRFLVSMAAGASLQPAMFWAQDAIEGGANLWFFFKTPSPRLLGTLIDGRTGADDVVTLGRGVPGGGERLSRRVAPLLDPDLTLADVLDLSYRIGREIRGRL